MIPALVVAGVGALAQAGSNMYAADKAAEANEYARQGAANAAYTMSKGYENVKGTYDSNNAKIKELENKLNTIYGDDAIINRYKSLLNSDMSDAIYNPSAWTDKHSIEEYYDKAWKLNNQTQLDALEASASNAGRLYSSGLQNQMLSTASANASKAYKDAMEAYLKEKGIDVDIWKGEEANKLASSQQYLDKYKTQLNAASDYTKAGTDLWSDVTSAYINNANAKANTYTNYLSEYAKQIAAAGGGSAALPNY